ncbi:MAG: GFA family protein [Bradyrhizobium sp.]|nr:GFA family protein [Bradyrhizobium sp.]
MPRRGVVKPRARAAGIAEGQCLCGKVAFEIDVPARWAWHDHSSASRRAHGAAYATYVGSWRKRFRITKGKSLIARYEDKESRTARSFCAHCGTPLLYERARSPHMVNLPRALFTSRTGRQPLYHIAIEELQQWAYTGEPLVPLKGFPGVVWQRSKKKRRSAGEDPFELAREEA